MSMSPQKMTTLGALTNGNNTPRPDVVQRRRQSTLGLSGVRDEGRKVNGDGTPSNPFINLRKSIGGPGKSPVLSRRASASPLFCPGSGLLPSSSNSKNGISHLLERNRQEPTFPQTESEHLYLIHERILWSKERSLLPLAHDLADWLSTILGKGLSLTPENLMYSLQTGVILCDLAKLIEAKASSCQEAKMKPKFKGKVQVHASRGSFFARDNVAMFIQFCKDLGVHSNLLFETEDLVSHGEVQNVLLCLMEVGRLCVKYGIEPPALVQFEAQIDSELAEEERAGLVTGNGGGGSATDSQVCTTTEDEDEPDELNRSTPKSKRRASQIPGPSIKTNNLSDSLDSGLPVEEEHINGGGDGFQVPPGTCGTYDEFEAKTVLDKKVSELAISTGRHCSCVEETRQNFKLRRLSEGKYLINGRTVFVRLLKGIHVMVRVGGGWETLEEFLVRNDPCQGRTGAMRRRSSFGYSLAGRRFSQQQNTSSSSPLGCLTGTGGCTASGRPASSPPIMMMMAAAGLSIREGLESAGLSSNSKPGRPSTAPGTRKGQDQGGERRRASVSAYFSPTGSSATSRSMIPIKLGSRYSSRNSLCN